jgi:Icc-related predicted phosphoesterase
MRLALISDTHMRHASLRIPEVDVLIHAGDFTHRGRSHEAEAFVAWFAEQPGEKILVAGNHDFCSEHRPEMMRALAAQHGITYLVDEAATVAGLRVFGSPMTPAFRNGAWNRARGPSIRASWDQIPDDLDVLVTHGPPHRVRDRTFFGTNVGCADLGEIVRARAPKLHVFGHIHEDPGEAFLTDLPTRFVNAASTKLFGGVRDPIVITL